MTLNIAVMPGDGIGAEVVPEALRVLETAGGKYGFDLSIKTALIGGAAYDETGDPLPEQTVRTCKEADAVILRAVGGDKWKGLPYEKRPEAGLLGIRKALGLYANLRPAVLYPEMLGESPLKEDICGGGFNIMRVRELTGGIYFGEKDRKEDYAYDVEKYSEAEVTRIARKAFEIALKRNKKVTNVDKANVLLSSVFWRDCILKVAESFPEVKLDHLYVDNASMQLIRVPAEFDVVVTSNMFGDILSDEASMLTGSIGLLPSASLGDGNYGMYEPVHGSAPDIAGKGIANPIAQILSCAMMLEYTFDMKDAADSIENAVRRVLGKGLRTADLAHGGPYVSTAEMTDAIIKELR